MCDHFKMVPACTLQPDYPEVLFPDDEVYEEGCPCEDFRPGRNINWIYGTCNLVAYAPLMAIIDGVRKWMENKQYIIEENAIAYWNETCDKATEAPPPIEMWGWTQRNVAPRSVVRDNMI